MKVLIILLASLFMFGCVTKPDRADIKQMIEDLRSDLDIQVNCDEDASDLCPDIDMLDDTNVELSDELTEELPDNDELISDNDDLFLPD